MDRSGQPGCGRRPERGAVGDRRHLQPTVVDHQTDAESRSRPDRRNPASGPDAQPPREVAAAVAGDVGAHPRPGIADKTDDSRGEGEGETRQEPQQRRTAIDEGEGLEEDGGGAVLLDPATGAGEGADKIGRVLARLHRPVEEGVAHVVAGRCPRPRRFQAHRHRDPDLAGRVPGVVVPCRHGPHHRRDRDVVERRPGSRRALFDRGSLLRREAAGVVGEWGAGGERGAAGALRPGWRRSGWSTGDPGREEAGETGGLATEITGGRSLDGEWRGDVGGGFGGGFPPVGAARDDPGRGPERGRFAAVVARPHIPEELEPREPVAGCVLDHEDDFPHPAGPFEGHHPDATGAPEVDRAPRKSRFAAGGDGGAEGEGLELREGVGKAPRRPPPGVVDPAAEERVTPRRPPEGRLQPAGVEWPLDIAGEEKTHRIARAAVPQQELLKRGERAGRGHGAGEACRGEGSRKPRPYRQPGGGGSARSIGSRGLGLRPARVNPDNSPRLRERFGGFLDSQRPLSILVFPRLIRDRASWPPSTAPRRGC